MLERTKNVLFLDNLQALYLIRRFAARLAQPDEQQVFFPYQIVFSQNHTSLNDIFSSRMFPGHE